MLTSLDNTTTDAIQNFHDALQRSQEALRQEEARLAQLSQAAQQQHDANSTRREFIRTQQQPRLDALHREIARVRSLLEQQRCEVRQQQSQLEAIRRPRRDGEAKSSELRRKVEGQQWEYSRRATAVQSVLLQWWCPQNSLENLTAAASRRGAEVEALRRSGAALQAKLEELVAANCQHDSTDDNMSNLAGNGETCDGNENDNTTTAEECCNNGVSAESLQQQLKDHHEEREAFLRSSAEVISTRRRESQRLKAELQRLCTAVEEADAARQESQQRLRAALNEHGDACVKCCRCGVDVVGSFVS
ncbi:unnamed protein product [Trypanosoma congolense IL3000]|uniref:WGS project CAEQ00000000 data, annotated contig 1871 n=1 Tax=Trypanosoma congolense (strain IL3000) TaxID=1068625 RepID=F9W9K3_TRYCI|nr:unnamed protein product [Trypanosoma congolense IL3000]